MNPELKLGLGISRGVFWVLGIILGIFLILPLLIIGYMLLTASRTYPPRILLAGKY